MNRIDRVKQMIKVAKIDDPRLKDYGQRMRNGTTQVFYTGRDHRDWERYRTEGGGRDPNVIMHDKPDTIHVEPPERHLHAELIDGEWWWVNDCAECCGRPRDWTTYVECEKHNVCRTCGCSRESLTEPPWGGKNGWQCKHCADREHEERKQAALAVMPSDEDFDQYYYEDLNKVKCPYCDAEIDTSDDSWAYEDGRTEEVDCWRCDHKFDAEVSVIFSYTTKRKEQSA